jgi:hypothetical protein
MWLFDQILSHQFPRLASFSRNEGVSVFHVMHSEDLDSLFMLPLSSQALDELEILQEQVQLRNYDEDDIDQWKPIWGNQYSAKSYYSYVFKGIHAHPTFKAMWKSRCIPRIKFFVWLILVDRLNTGAMLQRRHFNIQGTLNCVLCNLAALDTVEHLFFTCPFAQACWTKLGIAWNLNLQLFDHLWQAKSLHNIPMFAEVSMTALWEMWKLRNDKVFKRRQPSVAIWFVNFKNQCLLQSIRFKEDLGTSYCVWLDAFS